MEKKDLEDLKERLENAEFNNYEEDLKAILQSDATPPSIDYGRFLVEL